MGLLGKKTKRQRTEDPEDLDFDDEMVDSLDMPDEEDGPSGGMLSKVLKWRRKGESDEADQDEDPGNAEDPPALEEDSPVQVVRLEGIPDVHPVGNSNSSLMPGQKQTGAGPGSTGSSGAQPAANSSPAEGNTPVDLDRAAEDDTTEDDTTEGDTTEDGSNTDGEKMALSLQDIFAEEEVNESLRDLADFVEDTLAKDLADELRAFLEELEARQN